MNSASSKTPKSTFSLQNSSFSSTKNYLDFELGNPFTASKFNDVSTRGDGELEENDGVSTRGDGEIGEKPVTYDEYGREEPEYVPISLRFAKDETEEDRVLKLLQNKQPKVQENFKF